MKNFNRLTLAGIALGISTMVWGDSNAHENDQANMPMMNQGEAGTMVDSQSGEKKVSTGDQHMQQHEKSMMGAGNHEMMMEPHMMHMMRHYQMGQHQDMSSVAAGNRMMNPEMMQNRQQHMENMEQRLANIEALLTRLVEQQKP